MSINKLKEIRHKNIRRIIEERFNGSVPDFAKKVKRQASFFYESSLTTRNLGEKLIRDIEASLNLQKYELDREDGGAFMNKKFELINVYSCKLSAGNGNEVFDEEIIDQLPVNVSIIESNGWKVQNLCFFNVIGDSMEPTLHNGSKVLIDTAQHEIINNKIYALRCGDQIYVKRLFKDMLQAKLTAKSDNTFYPEMQIDLFDDNSEIKIIGKAVLKMEEI